ncbi:MAG: cation:proton antiporter [Acidobacteriota bacterium]
MQSHGFLGLLGLLLGLAFASEEVFRRWRIPPALALMLSGFLVGPVLKLMPPERFLEVAPHFGALAFLLILLEGGLDLDLERTIGSLRTALRTAAVTFVLSWTLIAAIAAAHGLGWRAATLLGLALAPLSGAILIPLLGRLELPQTLRAVLVVDAALADVFGVLGLSLAIQLLEPGGWKTLLAVGTLLAAVLSIALGVALGLAWPHAIRSLSERAYLDVLGFGVALALWGAVASIGAPGAPAVLAFGLTLGNESKLRSRLRLPAIAGVDAEGEVAALHRFIGQLNFVIRTFFFVLLGVVVRLDEVTWRGASLVVCAVIAALAIRYLALRGLPLTAAGPSLALLVAMQPRGLVNAVLAIDIESHATFATTPLAIVSLAILLTNLVLAVALVRWGKARTA